MKAVSRQRPAASRQRAAGSLETGVGRSRHWEEDNAQEEDAGTLADDRDRAHDL